MNAVRQTTYTSHADLGGKPGHGRVVPEPEGEGFHADWEPGVLALTLAMGATGSWNIDMSRAARETLPHYARLSYYEIWFEALVKLLAERQLVHGDELAAGRALHPPRPIARTLAAADVPAVLAKGSPTERPATAPAQYAVGQACTRASCRTTPACQATCAASAAWSRGCMARMCSPMHMPAVVASSRTGCTRWCSMAANCGAMRARPA
jgi:hypothetical protein